MRLVLVIGSEARLADDVMPASNSVISITMLPPALQKTGWATSVRAWLCLHMPSSQMGEEEEGNEGEQGRMRGGRALG